MMRSTKSARSLPALAALVAAIVLAACGPPDPGGTQTSSIRAIPPVLSLDEGDLRYTYHVMSATEALFDLREDPRCLRNLLPGRAGDARRLRRRLESEWGVVSLDDLRERKRRMIEELETLGYL
jgi:hypothetical protein